MNRVFYIALTLVILPHGDGGFIKKVVTGIVGDKRASSSSSSSSSYAQNYIDGDRKYGSNGYGDGGDGRNKTQGNVQTSSKPYKNTTAHIIDGDFLTPTLENETLAHQQRPPYKYGGGGTIKEKPTSSKPYKNTTAHIIDGDFLTPTLENETLAHQQRPPYKYGGGGTIKQNKTTSSQQPGTPSYQGQKNPSTQMPSSHHQQRPGTQMPSYQGQQSPSTQMPSSHHQQRPNTERPSFQNQQRPSTQTSTPQYQQRPSTGTFSSQNQHGPSTQTSSSQHQQRPSTQSSSFHNQQGSSTGISSSQHQQRPSTQSSSFHNQQGSSIGISSSQHQQRPSTQSSSFHNQQGSSTGISSSQHQQRPSTQSSSFHSQQGPTTQTSSPQYQHRPSTQTSSSQHQQRPNTQMPSLHHQQRPNPQMPSLHHQQRPQTSFQTQERPTTGYGANFHKRDTSSRRLFGGGNTNTNTGGQRNEGRRTGSSQGYKYTTDHIADGDFLTPTHESETREHRQRPKSKYGGGGTVRSKRDTPGQEQATLEEEVTARTPFHRRVPIALDNALQKGKKIFSHVVAEGIDIVPIRRQNNANQLDASEKNKTNTDLTTPVPDDTSNRPSERISENATVLEKPNDVSNTQNATLKQEVNNTSENVPEKPNETTETPRSELNNTETDNRANCIILQSDSITCIYTNIKEGKIENRKMRCNGTECTLEKNFEKASLWACEDIKCTVANVDFYQELGDKKLIECKDQRSIITVQDKPIKCGPDEKEHNGRCRKIFGA